MDYCNKYALCKAKELKALKFFFSILPTSAWQMVTEICFSIIEHGCCLPPLLQEKVKIYIVSF